MTTIDFNNASWWAGCELRGSAKSGVVIASAPRGTTVYVLYHGKGPVQTMSYRIENRFDGVDVKSAGSYQSISHLIASATAKLVQLGYLKGN